MKDYFFTFGCGSANALKYVRISARSEEQAREAMFKRYGKDWAFCYGEEEFKPQICTYGMAELEHFVAGAITSTSEPTNKQRAESVQRVLSDFSTAEYGVVWSQLDEEDKQSCIHDLLSNLFHFMDMHGIDKDFAVLRATQNYQIEVYEQGRLTSKQLTN